jgi:hypothetical protein
MWGDFNIIRNKSEMKGISFNVSNMSEFNNLIIFFYFIDFKFTDHKYMWARGT